jgi:hypothetical protein
MPRKYSDEWFDQELAELKAGLDRLESSLSPTRSESSTPKPARAQRAIRPRPPRRKKAEVPSAAPVGAGESAVQAASPAPASPPPENIQEVAAPMKAEPALPTGTDLAEPRNFGLLPSPGSLERRGENEADYRDRIAQELKFAHQVLHTSGVVPAVWRAWRAHEKTLQDTLRVLNARPAPEPGEE